MFIQPLLSDFILSYPSYADPEYVNDLQEVMDDAYITYGDLISRLPGSKQLTAYKYLICHFFQQKCWESCGYAGSPSSITSRNDSVSFSGNLSGLKGSTCGRNFLAIVKSSLGGMYFAGKERIDCIKPCCG